ncbi:MAG TPA: MarR family winged helix-turn-helix transcriptional regulator [Candidatus Dormibacteraeota bacterium]|jgi:DNA-binding MarR family transcriptional regulator/RimJ/RimL family protein N-acetyltransferase
MSDATAIQRVRSFNRTVAERIGTLNDHFLGRGRPYGESRMLWEIGPDGAEVRVLRARLGLDSGYISRVLRALENARLIRVEVSGDDGRVRRVRLTAAGRRERAELDRRSDAVAASLLEPLSANGRASLLKAMGEVERLLQASLVEFAVEDPGSKDAQWCLHQYFSELNRRFDAGFDPTQGISADPHELLAPRGAFVIARLSGRPIGCGALKYHGRAPAELKRMWLAPEARGLGLGRRLLHELERIARMAGVRVVRLETNRSLKEAIALYRSSGYREVAAFNDEPYAHFWFEKRLLVRRPAPRSSS